MRVTFQGAIERRAFDVPSVLQFIVDASGPIALSLFSSWLYDKIKDRSVKKIKIRRKEITKITPEAIKKTLEEEIKKDR